MHTPRQKKREEQKGFDLLEAIYAEKGLISTGGSSRLMAAKAVGDTQALTERHVHKNKERHRANFVEGGHGQKQAKRSGFLQARSEKREQMMEKLPPQMKKPDIDDPKGKKKK